jgi:hypothetical protein
MRLPIALMLILAVGGCANVRKGLGSYQQAADKGVGLNTAAAAESAPAASKKDGKKPELPGGLGGDTAHPAYSAVPQS